MDGPSNVGPIPLRTKDGSTLLKDKNKIKTCWVEHFSELFNNDSPADETIFGGIPQHPIHHDLADAPHLPDVAKSIKQLKYHKSASPDGIPSETYKCGGISMPNRILQSNRDTVDIIFTARQLREKAREQYQTLYMTFYNLTKAFNSVIRSAFWKILSRFGWPDKYINIVRLFHDNMQATILCNGHMTDPIVVRTGVKQGCVIVLTLFSLILAAILHIIEDDLTLGVQLTYRIDGKIFNIKRLKATKKTTTTFVVELQYADDTFVNSCIEDLQIIVNAFTRVYNRLGLNLNTSKTKVLYQNPPNTTASSPPHHCKRCFSYLSNFLSQTANIDAKVQHRISSASVAFGRLRQSVR
ncbi:uncharacterized protein LOC143020174 [Oratosquilla oratoria]|uniref:uncharacterized protein LOC143020174 n=1 Tax=Oratosquilla oratoria TaxID=337810 RepID=UPI003F771F74